MVPWVVAPAAHDYLRNHSGFQMTLPVVTVRTVRGRGAAARVRSPVPETARLFSGGPGWRRRRGGGADEGGMGEYSKKS